MTFGEQMKRKADEVHLQDKAKDLGGAVADLVKAAVGIAASYTSDNRDKVDGVLDKAEAKISEHTAAKHADKVGKARAKVDHGIDKLVEKQVDKPVPADKHSAFDEGSPEGSPS